MAESKALIAKQGRSFRVTANLLKNNGFVFKNGIQGEKFGWYSYVAANREQSIPNLEEDENKIGNSYESACKNV